MCELWSHSQFREISFSSNNMGLQRWGDEPSQHTSFGGQEERAFTAYILWSSGFVRMELLRLTDVQSGPCQTRMSHWRCDILKQVALKRPSVWDGRFTRSSLSVSPSNSKCSQIFTPPGYMLFMLWLPLPPANEKSIHSARMNAAQALISTHPANDKDKWLRKDIFAVRISR